MSNRDLVKTPTFVPPGLARGRLLEAASFTAADPGDWLENADDLRKLCSRCCGTGLGDELPTDCPKCGGTGLVW